MRRSQRKKGKFWPPVRRQIWRKAQELFQEEQLAMGEDFKGITATRRELMEGGYFHEAKIIVLRNRYYASKGLPSVEERELVGRYGDECLLE
jgi:hypothetical protein